MSMFSLQCCYAALTAYASEGGGLLDAILQMVIVVVDERKYKRLDVQEIVKDFEKRFHFTVPYHPMQMVIGLGIDKGYFEYNSALDERYPIWEAINSGEFMKTFTQKESEYESLLTGFDGYLQQQYNMYCSREDLSNQVQAFIQRDGLVAKADRSILKKVQNDFLFASYLLFCQEHGNFAPLEYIDEYITGCALEELLAFDAPIESRNHCHTNVYLDTGFIFALLGIESTNRSEHFKALLDDMVSLGMRLNIFEHTYAEISSIIASSAHWIGNPYYDPSEASEATYFFASNGWSRQRVNELVSNLRSILIENYSIKIDNTRYPLKEDIRTMYQENIKEQIVAEYSATNPRFSLEEKAQTIEFDSRSLFMLLHYNDGFSAQTLPDLKYIFVTTNRSLARVGKKIALKSFRGNANGIPIAINDLVWGSLIWSHSPTKISGLNKASIISAAFAAFMPTEAMLKKLNKTLLECADRGDISPETCYFLKTNTMALQTLAQLTQNNEEQYNEKTPHEVLKKLKESGYNEGIAEKQKEVDQLLQERERVDFESRIAGQQAKINQLVEKETGLKRLLTSVEENYENLKQQFDFAKEKKKAGDKRYKNLKMITSIVIFGLGILFAVGTYHIPFGNEIFNSLTGFIIPLLIVVIYVMFGYNVSLLNVGKAISETFQKKAYSLCSFDPAEYSRLMNEIETKELKKNDIQKELHLVADQIKQEKSKIDEYSVDIDLTAQ